MANSFYGLTGYAAIRATLGVADDQEMPDTYIYNTQVEEDLEADLLSWVPYDISALVSAGTGTSFTPKARMQYLYLSSYAKFFCAVSLAGSLNTLLNKTITDGQNQLIRQDRDLPKFIEGLKAAADASRAKFLEASGQTAASGMTIISRAPPGYDPVTNETSS